MRILNRDSANMLVKAIRRNTISAVAQRVTMKTLYH